MEVRINKEVRDYQESLFFGLSLRQLIFALLAVAVAALARRVLAPRLTSARAQALALPLCGGYALLGAVLLFQHYFVGPVYTVHLLS